jgi:hypothetical protein
VPTGVADAAAAGAADSTLAELHDRVERVSAALGRRIKILVAPSGELAGLVAGLVAIPGLLPPARRGIENYPLRSPTR